MFDVEIIRLWKIMKLLPDARKVPTLLVHEFCSHGSGSAVIALIMFLFGSSTVLGLFFKHINPKQLPQEKVQRSNFLRQRQSKSFRDNSITKYIPDIPRGSVRCVTHCPILLKVTECRLRVIQLIHKLKMSK